jgi:hypothetical protein
MTVALRGPTDGISTVAVVPEAVAPLERDQRIERPSREGFMLDETENVTGVPEVA